MDNQEQERKKLEELLNQPHWTEQELHWWQQYLEQEDPEALRRLMEQEFTQHSALPLSTERVSRMLQQLEQHVGAGEEKRRLFPLGYGRRLAVAASLVLVVVALGVLYPFGGGRKPGGALPSFKSLARDVAPGTHSAVLTLADGATIVLDEAVDGTLAHQGGSRVIKLGGRLSYEHNSEQQAATTYNTITTLRGNQYQVVLADGTRVWLNAASSLRVPTAFRGAERRVQLSGEAYFEVAKDPQRPFTVVSSDVEVTALGTHFNVNAYADEKELRATLSEGKVRVRKGGRAVVLAPAQQALLPSGEDTFQVLPADLDKALAWKSGVFEFDGDHLPVIMRQIARWYNVEVHFSGKPSAKTYNGTISRDATLLQVLEILQLAGVSWSLEGRSLTIRE